MHRYSLHLKNLSLSAMLGLTLSGCAAPAVVREGDTVEMSFTCLMPGGELAATTRRPSSVEGLAKSPLYLPRTGAETVSVKAGAAPSAAARGERRPFEQEIVQRLALKVPGLREGEVAQWELQAENYPVAGAEDRMVKMATVRKRQKEMRLSREEYATRTGKSPEVGQTFAFDPMVPGQVGEVTEKEVVIRFAPVPGEELGTPFGPVTVRELKDRYELEIAAEPGRLVRTGAMVGRIGAVDEDKELMTIDYRHPFAGEKLKCEVRVVRVKEPAAAGSGAGGNADAPAVDPKLARQLDDALLKIGAEKEGGAGRETSAAATAAPGDLATVRYTAMLEDGTVFYSNRKEVVESSATRKAPWFASPKDLAGESVQVGKAALLPGIGEALSEMAVGGKRHLVLPPEKAFGPSDPQKVVRLPLSRTIPLQVTLPAEEYLKRFRSLPVAGKEVPATPYFPARVVAVRDNEVDLLLLAEDGKSLEEPFGATAIKVEGGQVTITLKPVPGSLFPGETGAGIITSSDADTFTVDLNNPLAGKTVSIDLELTALSKAAHLPGGPPSWQEEHDAGLALARKEGKPAVLVLYAPWCGFCEKLFGETIPDARIAALRDQFTWIKVDSDKLSEVKKRYDQNGYPMIVLFSADGSVAQTLDGYQSAAGLWSALKGVL